MFWINSMINHCDRCITLLSHTDQVNKLSSFFNKVIRTEYRGLLTCLLENVDFMFSLLHVYLYNLYNCHKLYCLMTIKFWIWIWIWYIFCSLQYTFITYFLMYFRW
jgi:hypothetical protein